MFPAEMRCIINTQPIEVRGTRIGSGIPKIIVPIVGETREEILAEAAKITAANADVIEWRADFYDDVRNAAGLAEMLAELRAAIGETPVIFTIRTSNEGGKLTVSDEEYAGLLKAAAASGNADLIDVELFRFGGNTAPLVRAIQEAGALTILSNHEFHTTPEKGELLRRLRLMEEAGADILKIAVMPQTRADVLTLLAATSEMAEQTVRPMITMSMGGLGSVSRLTGEIFGSAMTFGTVGRSSAPGQIPMEELRAGLSTIHDSYMKD